SPQPANSVNPHRKQTKERNREQLMAPRGEGYGARRADRAAPRRRESTGGPRFGCAGWVVAGSSPRDDDPAASGVTTGQVAAAYRPRTGESRRTAPSADRRGGRSGAMAG